MPVITADSAVLMPRNFTRSFANIGFIRIRAASADCPFFATAIWAVWS